METDVSAIFCEAELVSVIFGAKWVLSKTPTVNADTARNRADFRKHATEFAGTIYGLLPAIDELPGFVASLVLAIVAILAGSRARRVAS